MKTKNALLGIFAFLFAIGSAFASLTVNPDAWVREDEDFSSPCLDITNECNDEGNDTCVVSVSLGGPAVNRTAYLSGCTTELKTDQATPIPAQLEP